MWKLSELKEAFRGEGFVPRKSLGQNFLVDERFLRGIADAAEIRRGENVLEIGAGNGAMTGVLLERGARVLAVEIDARLCAIAANYLRSAEGLVLFNGDAIDPDRYLSRIDGGFKVVSNLPYSRHDDILVALLPHASRIDGMVLLVQNEVAQKLMAKPGERPYGALSVLIHPFFSVRIVGRAGAGMFYPRPRVSSALVRMDPRSPSTAMGNAPCPLLYGVLKRLFSQRRRRLRHVVDSAFPEIERPSFALPEDILNLPVWTIDPERLMAIAVEIAESHLRRSHFPSSVRI